jgi:hypothetical protein
MFKPHPSPVRIKAFCRTAWNASWAAMKAFGRHAVRLFNAVVKEYARPYL